MEYILYLLIAAIVFSFFMVIYGLWKTERDFQRRRKEINHQYAVLAEHLFGKKK
jgi:hypothetical protein